MATPSFPPMNTALRATTAHLPPRRLDNEAITRLLIDGSFGDASTQEIAKARERGHDIERKTGLKERHFFADDDDPVEVGLSVLETLLAEGGLPWHELDGILVSTSSVHGFPGISQQLVARARERGRSIGDPFVLDIGSNACTGFMYALGIADAFLATGRMRNVAVIAVEFASRCLDYHVRSFGISTLFGDAAAGLLLSSEAGGSVTVESVRLGSRTDGERITHIRGSGLEASDLRAQPPRNARWFMSGPPVAIDAIDIIVTEVERYRSSGVVGDWLIPHQGNLTRILHPACDRLAFPRERLLSSFEHTGNTSSASIPLLLDGLVRSGNLRKGEDILMVGFGASFSVGSAHLKSC